MAGVGRELDPADRQQPGRSLALEFGQARDGIVIAQREEIESIGSGGRDEISDLPCAVGVHRMRVQIAAVPAKATRRWPCWLHCWRERADRLASNIDLQPIRDRC